MCYLTIRRPKEKFPQGEKQEGNDGRRNKVWSDFLKSPSEMTRLNVRSMFVIITSALLKLSWTIWNWQYWGTFYLQNSNFICDSMYTTQKNMSLIKIFSFLEMNKREKDNNSWDQNSNSNTQIYNYKVLTLMRTHKSQMKHTTKNFKDPLQNLTPHQDPFYFSLAFSFNLKSNIMFIVTISKQRKMRK